MKTAIISVTALFVIALLAFAYLSPTSFASLYGSLIGARRASETMLVHPPSIQSLPRVELADLVAVALPQDGFENLRWDYLATEPTIAWQTEGVVETYGGEQDRIGIAHVSVAGKLSTVLRQTREELAWTVTLATNGSAKFGPKWIAIEPGIKPDGCFGTLYEGCTFNSDQALASPKTKSKLICRFPDGSEEIAVYSISTTATNASLLVYHIGRGSGGESSDLEIRPLSAQSTACNAAR